MINVAQILMHLCLNMPNILCTIFHVAQMLSDLATLLTDNPIQSFCILALHTKTIHLFHRLVVNTLISSSSSTSGILKETKPTFHILQSSISNFGIKADKFCRICKCMCDINIETCSQCCTIMLSSLGRPCVVLLLGYMRYLSPIYETALAKVELSKLPHKSSDMVNYNTLQRFSTNW